MIEVLLPAFLGRMLGAQDLEKEQLYNEPADMPLDSCSEIPQASQKGNTWTSYPVLCLGPGPLGLIDEKKGDVSG